MAKIALMLFEFRLGMPRVRRTQELALFDRYISTCSSIPGVTG
ncbi:MAG: hypothetical protein R3D59_01475 [Paracoccaceae bacterium]